MLFFAQIFQQFHIPNLIVTNPEIFTITFAFILLIKTTSKSNINIQKVVYYFKGFEEHPTP
jgi:hypothetical protein